MYVGNRWTDFSVSSREGIMSMKSIFWYFKCKDWSCLCSWGMWRLKLGLLTAKLVVQYVSDLIVYSVIFCRQGSRIFQVLNFIFKTTTHVQMSKHCWDSSSSNDWAQAVSLSWSAVSTSVVAGLKRPLCFYLTLRGVGNWSVGLSTEMQC